MRNRSDHDPSMIRPWSEHDPTTHETVSHPSHRRGRSSRFGDGLCMEKHRVSCICYQNIGFRASAISQKRISCETSFKTPSATPLPAPLAMPFALRERSYSCKSQWNSVDRTCTKHRWNPIYNAEPIRAWSEHDPNMIRPHTRPSRTRRTADIDHRGSGTDFVWKNIGFRASAISQKRISCETSFKTPSATPPPAPLAMPFALRERSYSCKSQWNSIGNSSTSTTCNPIYIAGTILQLQITMEFCRPHMHETQVKHLQCGTDPSMIRPWSEHDPTTHETVSHPSHRRGRSSRFGDGLCMEKHRGFVHLLSLKNAFRARLPSKLHRQLLHQHHLQCHLHCGNDPTVANHNGIPSATHPPAPLAIPFTLRERSYSCKSQWNSVDCTCTKHRWNPIYNAEPIRAWSAHNPNMIWPHTRPSRTRRTAEVDHRGSGTDFVWKNIVFRASAISQKRISCETSFKTPSATPPPAPLAMPFALRERSYSCKSQWNSIGNSSTSTTCNPIYIAGTILQLQITMEFCRPHMHETQVKPHLQCGTDPSMIRPWSEHDPTTHETVSHPSHSRGRSSRFGDGLCMEKHRVSCICYLSKTHFVRDFLQKSNLKMSFTINSVPH